MIQQVFNMFWTMFMGKIMLNDIPHYVFEEVTSQTLRVRRVTASEEPPTPAQIRYIALLCQQLHIKEPLEERVKTRGEAGVLIRQLKAQKERTRGQS